MIAPRFDRHIRNLRIIRHPATRTIVWCWEQLDLDTGQIYTMHSTRRPEPAPSPRGQASYRGSVPDAGTVLR